MTTTFAPRHRALAAALTASALALSACGSTQPGSTVLEQHGLAGMDATEVVEHLDTMAVSDRPDTLIASVQPTELVLTDTTGGSTATLPMPDDTFYLSVAPYRNTTHDCYFHSLTTCVGELGDEPLHLTVVGDDGEVLLDEERTTNSNGFVGLWLPRDIDATLTITHENGSITTPISTGADDPTCLTDLPLT